MNTIVALDEAKNLGTSLHGKKVVVAGGCFDLLHIGHVSFLEEAKKQGDVLVVLLESDEAIKKNKGPNRPINTQKDRAQLLAAFRVVDYVVLLDPDMTNEAYDALVISLKPAIIAATKGDAYRFHKERQAAQIGAKVIDVIQQVENRSTSRLVDILHEI